MSRSWPERLPAWAPTASRSSTRCAGSLSIHTRSRRSLRGDRAVCPARHSNLLRLRPCIRATRRRSSRSSGWAASRLRKTSLSSSPAARRTSRSAPCCSSIPTRRREFAKSSLLSPWTTDTAPRTPQKNRWSSPQKPSLDRGGHVGSLGRPAMPASNTPTHAPLRSLDQRMDALKRANDVRVRRAKLKKDLKDGRVRIETILGNPPEYVSTAKVIDILMAVPKFGRVKAARFLNTCRISQSKTVGGLSDRQRAELIELFNR